MITGPIRTKFTDLCPALGERYITGKYKLHCSIWSFAEKKPLEMQSFCMSRRKFCVKFVSNRIPFYFDWGKTADFCFWSKMNSICPPPPQVKWNSDLGVKHNALMPKTAEFHEVTVYFFQFILNIFAYYTLAYLAVLNQHRPVFQGFFFFSKPRQVCIGSTII